MHSRRRRVAFPVVVTVIVASLSSGALLGSSARAADPADTAAAASAVSWLVHQQEADGGFELADFPGFETPDAVTAIAEAAQTGTTWSTSQARAAIEALAYGGKNGPTPIDALDDWVTAGINAGEASKLLLLVVAPLGLAPDHFGPSHTDLAAIVYPGGCASPPATSGLFFQEKVFVAFGGVILCGNADATVLASIRSAQRADGGWNFNGSTAPADPNDPFDPNLPDVDSTALAVQALVAGGAAPNDPALLKGLAYLTTMQSSTGAFLSFGSDDPNATAVAMLAITAAGFDPAASCWRDTAVPAAAGTPYAAPGAWIRSQQQPDGRIASPNDGSAVNTFATSQSVEGLLRSWLPLRRAGGAATCAVVVPAAPAPAAPVPVVEAAEPVELVARFTG